MKTIQYTTIDKSTWGPGPWQTEPDKIQYQDEATGFPCLVTRTDMGNLCGYVGVPESHPLFGKSDNNARDVCVHGGVTFADSCQPHATEESGVCHLPEPGESDNVWWFGFDCAHAGDFLPGMGALMKSISPKNPNPEPGYTFGTGTTYYRDLLGGDKYRDLAYVKENIAHLALQLKAAESNGNA
ncbi:MAG: hypothetical protein V4621_07785 [Pseudomonadota bacterium]